MHYTKRINRFIRRCFLSLWPIVKLHGWKPICFEIWLKSTPVSILDKLKRLKYYLFSIFLIEKFLKLILKKQKNIEMLAFSYDPFNLTPGRRREELSKERRKKNGLYVAILQKAPFDQWMPRKKFEKSLTDRSFGFFHSLQISFVFFIEQVYKDKKISSLILGRKS